MELNNSSETIATLIDKIQLISDETMENKEKGIRGTRVKIILENGNEIIESVYIPKGDPEKPVIQDDIINKLQVCAQGLTDKASLEKLLIGIKNISGNGEFDNPMRLLIGS